MKKNESELQRTPETGTAPTEKRSEWRFGTAEKNLWRWHVTHPDGTEVSSHRGFPTLKECIADATVHGYVVWIPEAERRKAK
jgi:hypothetical protein